MSAVALYYYLLILKQALVLKPAEPVQKIATPLVTALALLLAAALIIALGVNPSLLLNRL
jgi:NADH-quinone oxidoreductase subunit N